MTIRTLAVTLVSSALLAGTAAAPAMAQTAEYPTDSGSTQTTKKKHKKHGKKFTAAQLATIAGELDVTVDQLTTAMDEVKAAVDATDERESRREVDALLADKLGVTVAELRDAFRAARPARGERRRGHGGGHGGCRGRGRGDADSGDYPTDTAGEYPSNT